MTAHACSPFDTVAVSSDADVVTVCIPLLGSLPCCIAGGYAVGVVDCSLPDASVPIQSFAGRTMVLFRLLGWLPAAADFAMLELAASSTVGNHPCVSFSLKQVGHWYQVLMHLADGAYS